MSETWYRYQETHYAPPYDYEWGDWRGEGSTEIHLHEFTVVKHTPKGVWLTAGYGDRRFVLKDAYKRFACPTKEEAFESFLARKKREIKIYKARIASAERALTAAEKLAEGEGPDPQTLLHVPTV